MASKWISAAIFLILGKMFIWKPTNNVQIRGVERKGGLCCHSPVPHGLAPKSRVPAAPDLQDWQKPSGNCKSPDLWSSEASASEASGEVV